LSVVGDLELRSFMELMGRARSEISGSTGALLD
jgi:hypothetical protein